MGASTKNKAAPSTPTKEEVIDRVADKFLKNAGWDERQSILDLIGERIESRIRDIGDDFLKEAMAECLTTPMIRTNQFGERTAAGPITIREFIALKMEKAVTMTRDGYNRGSTVLDQVVESAISRKMKRELEQAAEEGKKQINEAIKAEAASLIQETISRVAGIKL